MNQRDQQSAAQLRWSVYLLLIAVAVGNMTGRLMAVNSVNRAELEMSLRSRALRLVNDKLKEQGLAGQPLQQAIDEATEQIEQEIHLQRPFLSANDRSRWLAMRALVEQGTFAIDDLLDRHRWNTIDMVQHQGRDGQPHLYSSKPPLLITLLAGEYWLIHKATGMTLESHPYVVGRLMLVTINILPMLLMFVLMALLVEQLGTTDWGRMLTMATATLGTFLPTYAVVLNNHLIGAVSATVALYAWVRISSSDSQRVGYFALAGLAVAFTAASELPALALLAMLALELWTCDRRAWWLGFAPAAAVVVAAFFATNYAAHQSLRPPYMHRSETDPKDNWYRYTYTLDGVERDSYWLDRQGIDRGEPSRITYALHVLIGHHGIFSLTPIWFLSLAGMVLWSWRGSTMERRLAVVTALLTAICLVFFIILRPQPDRNYGGMTSGFRWMFWFAPLWLATMLPAADWLARSRFGKALALILLAASVFSAGYPTWNPWVQPWIYNWMEYCGWQGF